MPRPGITKYLVPHNQKSSSSALYATNLLKITESTAVNSFSVQLCRCNVEDCSPTRDIISHS